MLAVVLLDRESLTVPHRSPAQLVAMLIDPATEPGAARPGARGVDMLSTLDVVVATGSILQVARSLRMHQNSVQHRVAQAERVFGFGLSEVYGRNRLFMALTLRRIRQTHGMV